MRTKQDWDIKRGSHIKVLRMRKGLTQEYVAKKIGVTVTSMKNWESGKVCPSILYHRPLAFLYSVTIEDLLSGDTESETVQAVEGATAEAISEDLNTEEKPKKTYSDLIAIISMITGQTEQEIIRDAVVQYAKGLDWAGVITEFVEG